MNSAAFGKTMGNVRKPSSIKLSKTERRRNYLLSEPNYHATEFFTENILAVEILKMQILINKPVNLGLLMLELNKMLMFSMIM